MAVLSVRESMKWPVAMQTFQTPQRQHSDVVQSHQLTPVETKIKNIQFETTGPDPSDFKFCQIAIWSAEYRNISTLDLYLEGQEGKYRFL